MKNFPKIAQEMEESKAEVKIEFCLAYESTEETVLDLNIYFSVFAILAATLGNRGGSGIVNVNCNCYKFNRPFILLRVIFLYLCPRK